MSADRPGAGKGFTFINPGSILQGELLIENDLTVEGKIKGIIRATGLVSINATGEVEGELQARSARIAGRMVGNVTVSERLILEAKSSLIGDIRTRELVIHEGAHFHGNCDMQPGSKGGRAAATLPSS